MAETNGYIRTWTGNRLKLMDPQFEQICIEDIAHGLSLCNRWSGQTDQAYSVAQHCVHMASRLRMCGHTFMTQFEALMHDASEAYLGDMASPLKALCPTFHSIELMLQGVIEDKFGITSPLHPSVKAVDMDSYRLENRDLMGNYQDIKPPVGNQPTLHPWSAEQAEREFLKCFRRLTGAIRAEREVFA